MKKTYTIHDDGAGVRIVLDFRGMTMKIGSIFIIPLIALGAAYFLYQFAEWEKWDLLKFVLLGGGFLLLMAVWYLLKLTTQTEFIEVDVQQISLGKRSLFCKEIKSYNWNEVTQIFCIRHQNFYPYPVDTNYMCMDIPQWRHVLIPILDGGALMIVTGDRGHLFAEELPSWDAEEVIRAIEKYTRKKFERLPGGELDFEVGDEKGPDPVV